MAILLLWAILPFGEDALIYKWQPRNLCLSPILSTLGIPSTYMFGNALGSKEVTKRPFNTSDFSFPSFLPLLFTLKWMKSQSLPHTMCLMSHLSEILSKHLLI